MKEQVHKHILPKHQLNFFQGRGGCTRLRTSFKTCCPRSHRERDRHPKKRRWESKCAHSSSQICFWERKKGRRRWRLDFLLGIFPPSSDINFELRGGGRRPCVGTNYLLRWFHLFGSWVGWFSAVQLQLVSCSLSEYVNPPSDSHFHDRGIAFSWGQCLGCESRVTVLVVPILFAPALDPPPRKDEIYSLLLRCEIIVNRCANTSVSHWASSQSQSCMICQL